MRSRLIIQENMSAFTRSPLLILELNEPVSNTDQETNLDTSDENAALIVKIETVSETSSDFNDKVKKAIISVPDSIRQLLAQEGYVIATSHSLRDTLPSSNEPGSLPWELIPTALYHEEKKICIAENTQDGNGGNTTTLNPE